MEHSINLEIALALIPFSLNSITFFGSMYFPPLNLDVFNDALPNLTHFYHAIDLRAWVRECMILK
jgi:hypothetical protein